MQGNELRQTFLEYFKSKGHTAIASSSLVPESDPTLLFANAGMNQFKDLFLGTEKRDYTRATTCQKVMRISGKHNDFENVGVTARHHTFFEMLGNFSFGDYFKKEAIQYGWEFVTEVLKLDKRRLWVTVFEEDDEAAKLWAELTDVKPDRILKMDAEGNFWTMGDTGPCGPSSEIFYYLGDNIEGQSEAEFRQDDGTYIEIWNLVFMQFERAADGTLTKLPKPSVDTGMGLERVAAIVQGKVSTYDGDTVFPIIKTCEKLTGLKYDGSSYKPRDLKADQNYARDVAMRVIADHSRSASFLIADGVVPGSDGRGYVLRRVIRRAIRHGKVLNFKEPFLKHTCQTVIDIFGATYPELVEQKDKILQLVDLEEKKFYETLDTGLAVLQKAVAEVKPGQKFPGDVAFLLHDTYGFPMDLTQDALKPYNLKVDAQAFDACMTKQKEQSRADRKNKDISFVSIKIDAPATEFIGYDSLNAEAKISAVLFAEADQKVAKNGENITLLFPATPFYAESGGQVGDSGTITVGDCILKVIDTQKLKGMHVLHHCLIEKGEVSPKMCGQKAQLAVDAQRRALIRVNHSATHLVHLALRTVLGEHVKQAGSRVDERTSRFDYSHYQPVTPQQLKDIQDLVNSEIWQSHDVTTRLLPLEEAKKTGAVALFGEKYSDLVRVVQIGPRSIEFCGGTHVTRSSDISMLLIKSEGGIAAGVRRIECVCGQMAYDTIVTERAEKEQLIEILQGDGSDLVERVKKINLKSRELEKQITSLQTRIANAKSGELTQTARVSPKGIKVIAERVDDGADTNTLRSMVDKLRGELGSGVVALGSTQDGAAIIVAGITSDLSNSLDAGALMRKVAEISGGKGGGRKDFAQAGGVKPELLGDALNKFFELVD